MRTAVLIICLLITQVSLAASLDTLLIKEVTVIQQKSREMAEKKFDSAQLAWAQALSIQQFLQNQSTVQFKTYGSSGSSILSIRGANASHSKVIWNGLNLNSSMLNVTDLSIIGLFGVDELNLHRGAASAKVGSGALSGYVEMNNRPSESNGTKAIIQLNSLYNTQIGVQHRYKVKQWSMSTSMGVQRNQNKFNYVNRAEFGNPEQPQINSEHNQWMIQQGLSRTWKKTELHLNLWYQEADRNLSPAMYNRNTSHYQLDASLRAALQLNYAVNKRQSIKQNIGYINEHLRYVHRIGSANTGIVVFNSISDFQSWQYQATYEYSANKWSHQAIVNIQYEQAFIADYLSSKSRTRAGLSSILEYTATEMLDLELSNRLEQSNNQFMNAHSFKIVYHNYLPGFASQLELSSNYNLPGLNDLYWQPGGNPDLQAEKSIELNFRSSYRKMFRKWQHELQANYYRSLVDDWILWQPSNFDNAIWTAQNLAQVRLAGFEWEQGHVYQPSLSHQFKFTGSYAYTQAKDLYAEGPNDQSEGKQLIYVPIEKINGTIEYRYKNHALLARYNFVSHRFTSTDNVNFLPSYQLIDLQISTKITTKRQAVAVAFFVENISNQAYESIPFQAMPGRIIGCSINLKTNQT